MKKVTGLFLAVALFMAVATPAQAAEGCKVVKVEGAHRVSIRLVCKTTEPANIDKTVTAVSEDGKAKATSHVVIKTSGNASVSIRSSVRVSVNSN